MLRTTTITNARHDLERIMNSEKQTAVQRLHDDIRRAVEKIEDNDDEIVRIHTVDNNDGA